MSGLRVIGGKARGRKLRSVPGDTTRPITDRTKEALFNILAGDLVDASFLDMFAGTGAVGIEALSRGAGYVRFLEIERRAVETIRLNLESTGLWTPPDRDCAEILQGNAFNLLQNPPDMEFDYIYIAPPQYKELWKRALLLIDSLPGWLAEDAWVIVQIDPIEYEAINTTNLQEFDERRYGSTLLVFYSLIA
jgi:16S rRNA (guanine966-N2)-methyltransferase